ncbi:hypothetical protein BH20ACI3_BH20ACI3_39470 [soil metagenome]
MARQLPPIIYCALYPTEGLELLGESDGVCTDRD